MIDNIQPLNILNIPQLMSGNLSSVIPGCLKSNEMNIVNYYNLQQ